MEVSIRESSPVIDLPMVAEGRRGRHRTVTSKFLSGSDDVDFAQFFEMGGSRSPGENNRRISERTISKAER